MFKLLFILKADFEQSHFKMSRAVYTTDSYTAAILLVEALRPCCQDFSVKYNDVKYLPGEWDRYVAKMALQNNAAKPQEIFYHDPNNKD